MTKIADRVATDDHVDNICVVSWLIGFLHNFETGIVNQPGWIMSSGDGRYIYPESGEVIDVAAKKVVGQLIGVNGNYVHSRFALEVDFRDGKVVRVGDQQGVGRIVAE